MPRTDIHTAVTTAAQALDATDTTPRDALNTLACSLADLRGTADPDLHRYVSHIESLARQVQIHGDPALDGYTVTGILSTADSNLTAFRNNNASLDDLTTHVTEIRDDILDARPDTTVIEDHGLEEAFSDAVRQALHDAKTP